VDISGWDLSSYFSRFVKPISVPLSDKEALFSFWQESKCKDINHFFGCFKEKFYFFSKPVPFTFIADILNAFYCSLVLHNMAVHKQFEACEEQRESDACYDYIADTEAEKNVQQEPWLNLVVQFTNMQEDHIRERALEVKYL